MGEDATWGRSDGRRRSRAPASGCCSPARRSARTTRRSRGSTYDDDGVSRADYGYGYTQALVDGVCRPVTFHTYDGDMEWVSDGRRRRADFDVVLPAAEAARRLRTALDPDGDWIAHVLRDADARAASSCAPATHPDAGGLVVARSTRSTPRSSPTGWRGSPASARTSCTPTRADASARIARFAAGTGTWLVSVLMVSEGVDVPRLRVGVYATTRPHRAVLPPGGRALHPPHAGAARTR